MSIKTETPHAGGFIVSEPDRNLSRKVVTVASGADLQPGTVLGKLTSGGKYTMITPGTSDGAQTAVAVLFDHAKAANGDVEALVIDGLAAVNGGELVWPPGIDANAKATAIASLEGKYIRVLDGDPAFATVTPTRLVFATVPAGGEEATDIGEVIVRVENDQGILMTGDSTTSVTLAKTTGSGTLTVTGGATKTALNGIVTFAGISFSADDTYTITASASGLVSAVSGGIVVTAAE